MSSHLTGVSGLTSLTLGSPLANNTVVPRPGSGFGSMVQSLIGNVLGKFGVSNTGINPEYSNLIEKQLEMQEQMQLVSLYSNIIKSEHETQMAATRNIRVG